MCYLNNFTYIKPTLHPFDCRIRLFDILLNLILKDFVEDIFHVYSKNGLKMFLVVSLSAWVSVMLAS